MSEPKDKNEAACGGSALTAGLAAAIARTIFECGDQQPEYGGPTQRIQFMGGTWPDHERPKGGLSEEALARVIEKALVANIEVKGRGMSKAKDESRAVLEAGPPVCWYIDFGRYGQITMRQDEAQRAADAGARVWLYASGTIVTSNEQK